MAQKKSNKNLYILIGIIIVVVLAYLNPQFFKSRAGGNSVDSNEGFNLEPLLKPGCVSFSPWGNPKIKDEKILDHSLYLCRNSYSVQYNSATKSPVWVSEILTKTNITRKVPDNIKFTGVVNDPSIPKNMQINLDSYKNSQYVPGQLAAINDLYVYYPQLKKVDNIKLNQDAINEGFYSTNSLPMTKSLRDLLWEPLSSQLRISFADNLKQQLYIISGPLYLNDKPEKVGDIIVPSHYFKIIVNPDVTGSVSYVFPNTNIPEGTPISQYIVGVKEIQRITGWEFFPNLANYYSMKIKLDPNEYLKEKEVE